MTRRVNSISKIINSLGTLVRDVIGDCHRSIEEIEGKKKKKEGDSRGSRASSFDVGRVDKNVTPFAINVVGGL